jgi:pyrimidine operon attenuation protein/uracil phosphoribosyltransferase
MEKQVILDDQQVQLTMNRLAYQLIENHDNFEETVLIGLQPRGIHVWKSRVLLTGVESGDYIDSEGN